MYGVFAQPDPDAPRPAPEEDGSIAFPRACELGITKFKADGGQCLMCCKEITYDTLRHMTVLGVTCNIRLYGNIEIIDNSDVIMTETKDFKETLTLGRDLRHILSFEIKSHLPAPRPDGDDGTESIQAFHTTPAPPYEYDRHGCESG